MTATAVSTLSGSNVAGNASFEATAIEVTGHIEVTLAPENPELRGVRIDSFLVRHFRNYTAWRMQRIVRAGQAKVDDVTVGPTFRVYKRQRVQVRLIEPPDKLLQPEAIPLDILYEDEALVVIDKPAGLVSSFSVCPR